MDRYCIFRGTLLDAPRYRTLEHPEQHSVHCLVDEGDCVNSGFIVLSDPAPGLSLYTEGYALDAAGNQKLTKLARQVGRCSTCDGGGSIVKGFRAGMIGTVVNVKADPPVIQVDSAEAITADDDFCSVDPTAPTVSPSVTSEPSISAWPTPPPSSAVRMVASLGATLVLTFLL